ncbi:mucosal addressin cell adhesion molecule 1 isoform X3 [Rhinatrema bivittatum]|uniref:mucosal addressin cell adhesion molecule 1 isoform X3 n=1 Tax=Rhinatrema bivittatum TaxID=194408 RepID=UPI00112BA6AC|nr:mucosal addressin cell adhesion molecule 1 isoform X3 [Rhinatrema bivittatum]
MSMGPALLLLTVGLGCQGKTLLTLMPSEPLVQLGSSIHLNCSQECPGGTVLWKGLDTNLGSIFSSGQYSILSISKAAVQHEGRKICIGQCQGHSRQRSVQLQVYSFPAEVELVFHPEGAPRLSCALGRVYPPSALALSWYRGGEKLPSPELQEEDEEEEELYRYESQLQLPAGGPEEGSVYRCEAALSLGQTVLHQETTLTFAREVGHDYSSTTATPITEGSPMTASEPGEENSTTKFITATGNPTTESVTAQANPRTESVANEGNPTTESTTQRNPTTESVTSQGNPTTEFVTIEGNPTRDSITTQRNPTTESVTDEGNPTMESITTQQNPTTESVTDEGNPTMESITTQQNPTTESVTDEGNPTTQFTSIQGNPKTESVTGEGNPTTESITTQQNPTTESVTANGNPTVESVTTDGNPIMHFVPTKIIPKNTESIMVWAVVSVTGFTLAVVFLQLWRRLGLPGKKQQSFEVTQP